MAYNKSERHTQEPEDHAGYKTINASSWGYIGIVINSGILFFFLLYTLCLFSEGTPAAYVTLFVTIIFLYVTLRNYFVDIKGKLCYNDTQLHYEGYTFDIFPRKHIVDIPWKEITYAWVYSQKVLRGTERDLLYLEKSDGSTITLNICYFNNSEIINLIHKHLLATCKANPIDHPEEYQITIHNYTSPFSIMKDYLQLEIFTNEESLKTREKQITLNVKTGDLLALKHYSQRLQIVRLKDPLRTEFYIDNFADDFDLIIRKAKGEEKTEAPVHLFKIAEKINSDQQ